jgi:hypothetical protein
MTLRKVLVSYAVAWVVCMIALAVLLNHPAAQVLFTPRVHLTQQRLDEPSPSKEMRVVGPYCPSEDSCVVDYHGNGKWTVTEVTP